MEEVEQLIGIEVAERDDDSGCGQSERARLDESLLLEALLHPEPAQRGRAQQRQEQHSAHPLPRSQSPSKLKSIIRIPLSPATRNAATMSLRSSQSGVGLLARIGRTQAQPSPWNRSSSHRTLFGFAKKKSPLAAPPPPLLAQDDLFHPLSRSPFPEMQLKAKRIQELAYCPVSMERGEKVHVKFECPDCGFPTHATEQAWAGDPEKGRYWPRLREANEDEHDLRSGREMTEFRLPCKPSSYPTIIPSDLQLQC